MYGKEEALSIIQQEMDNLDLIEDLVKKENIDCDFWRGKGAKTQKKWNFNLSHCKKGMDVFMSDKIKTKSRQALQEYEDDGGRLRNDWIEDCQASEKVS